MKKYFKYILIISPIVIAVGSIGTYYLINSQKFKNNYKNNKYNKQYTISKDTFDGKFDIFPDIKKEEIYDEIRIKEGYAIINDDMIAKFINFIIKGMQITEGDIEYGIKKINNQEVHFKFIWHGQKENYSANYKMIISK